MYKSLQSLRYIFVLMVFFAHYSYGSIKPFDQGGEIGVAFFFILSGFVLSGAYGKKVESEDFSTWKFCLKFLKKVYPLHLLCSLYIILVNVEHMTWSDYLEILPSLLLVQSWIPIDTYYWGGNPISWFLSNMLFCYAMFPLLMRLFNKLSDKHLATAIIFLLAGYAVFVALLPDKEVNYYVYVNPLSRLVDFILGAVSFRLLHSYSPSHNKMIVNTIEFGCVLSIVAVLAAHPHLNDKLREAAAYWPSCIATIVFFAAHEKKSPAFLSSLLSKKWLVGLGNSSFEFYMIHYLIIFTIIVQINKRCYQLDPNVLCICLIALTTASSTFLHKLLSTKKH